MRWGGRPGAGGSRAGRPVDVPDARRSDGELQPADDDVAAELAVELAVEPAPATPRPTSPAGLTALVGCLVVALSIVLAQGPATSATPQGPRTLRTSGDGRQTRL